MIAKEEGREEAEEEAEEKAENESEDEARGELVVSDKIVIPHSAVTQKEMFNEKVPSRVAERLVLSRDAVNTETLKQLSRICRKPLYIMPTSEDPVC